MGIICTKLSNVQKSAAETVNNNGKAWHSWTTHAILALNSLQASTTRLDQLLSEFTDLVSI